MIRAYEPADLDDLMAAWEAASALAHPFLDDAFVAQVRHDIPAVYLPNTETWVWVHAGRVVGFIALMGNEVGALFVDPAHHGAGFGRALMDHVHTLHGELEVEVFEANTVGRAFYDRYGFALLEEKIHEPTGHPVLRLRLAAS